jgi:Uma2 family endonuclease
LKARDVTGFRTAARPAVVKFRIRPATDDPIPIVEVLSPSNEAIDRREKLAAYRGLTSVQEYALVSQDRQQIEIYRRQGDIGWLYVSFEPGDEVEFASVGLRAPIAAFYEGTDVAG